MLWVLSCVGALCRHAIKVMAEGRETKLTKQITDQYVLKEINKKMQDLRILGKTCVGMRLKRTQD